MALEALLAKLDEDAARERAAVLEEAEERAARIREETERELARKRRQALDASRSEASATVRAESARGRAEARRMLFQAREEVLDRVRRATEERIAEGARDEAYRSALPGELAKALARAPEGPLRLEAPPPLLDTLRDALAGREEADGPVDVAAEETMGTGFVVVADEGRVEIDATLSARLDRVWPAEAMRVLGELDG